MADASDSYGKIEDILNGMFDDELKSDLPEDVGEERGGTVTRTIGVFGRYEIVSAFAYAVSRFTGSENSVFAAGKDGTFIPVRANCSDREVSEFIGNVTDTIEGIECLVKKGSDIPERYRGAENLSVCEGPFERRVSMDVLLTYEFLNEGVKVSLSFSDRHTEDVMERFMDAFVAICDGMKTEKRLSGIQYTTEKDIEELDALNVTETELRYGNIVEAFSEHAESVPDNILVMYLGRRYTYAEADVITDGIAHELSEAGVAKGDLVGVLVPRSEWYLLCALAVLKTGAGYVPIDETYPDERVLHMISDSNMKAILVKQETEERAKRLAPSVIAIDAASAKGHRFAKTRIDPGDVAVILYTSGTTGKPKGSQITHLAVINHAEWWVRYTKMTQDDIYGLYTSCAFDAHTTAYFPIMVCGASLDIIPWDLRLDLHELNDHFVRTGTTQTFITTQVGRMFASMDMPSRIRLLMYGGEKLGEFTAPEHLGALETYGPSENLVLSTAIYVNDRCCPSSVGPIVDNIKGYILDKEGRRVPRGAIGELWLSGYQLSSGYLGNAELNAKAFRPNIYVPDEKRKEGYDRIYATGDFFRFLPDGTLGILGRRDGQVKIRGNRVELTEVENVIRAMKGVSNVTVQAIVNERGGKELCAYVVSEDGRRDADRIKRYVSERKPEYMVPSYVMFIDRIPLNANSKVDRRALPIPDMNSMRKEYVAPGNANEKRLCDAFAKVLGIERIGIDDDFFALGGDSIKAICVQNLSEATTTADIMRYRTPRSIAEHIHEGSYDLNMFTAKTGCPLSESQLNVYLDIRANGKLDAYIVPYEFAIPEGHTEKDAEECIARMFRTHPILRSHIEERKDGPWLLCDEGSELSDDRCPDMGRSMSSFHVKDGKIVGYINHIVFDGFSKLVLDSTLEKLFQGRETERDTGFLKASSFDISIRGSEPYTKSKEYFESQFCDCDTDSGLLGDTDGRFGMTSAKLDVPADGIRDRCAKTGISAGAFFTSAFAYTLSRFTGRSDAVFAVAENGRSIPGLGGAVGMFVNTVPLHLDCSDAATDAFLRDSSDRIYGSMSSSIYPFRLVHNEYGVGSDVLFQFMTGAESASAVSLDVVDSGKGPMSVADLAVAVSELKDGYRISCTHSGRITDATMDRIVSSFEMIIRGLLGCDRLSDIQCTTDADKEYLRSINKTDGPKPIDILDAFDRTVTDDPDRRFVSFEDNAYTYAEIDGIGNRIAHELGGLGIGKGDTVGMLVQRSEWYIPAIIGILKSGAAYMPLDTDHADDRLSYMISDSKAKAMVVTPETEGRAAALCGLPRVTADGRKMKGPIGPGIASGDGAVILYTSGSTGRPKGCRLTAGNLSNMAANFVEKTDFRADDTFGMHASIGFDAPLMGIYSALLAGGNIDIIPEEIRLDIDGLNEHAVRKGITHLFVTTQLARMFVSRVGKTSLRALITGGEKLGETALPKGYRLFDLYGPTEATVFVTGTDVSEKRCPESVGRPNRNTRVYILDKEKRIVPVGAVGELHVAGHQLMRGYLDRDLDDKAFIKNVYDEAGPGFERLYSTGDFSRILPDGTVGILGRRDGQVKIRGNRVELTEVELSVKEIGGVKDVSVQAIVNANGGKELCAYVVADGEVDAHAVRTHIAETRPAFMVPSYVVFLDRIPLNINGKVDRRALPRPDLTSGKAYVAPRNDVERRICDAFAETLGLEKVGIYDDFFELGGDSLKAIGVQNLSGVATTADILNYRTPSAIAEHAGIKDYRTDMYTLETGCPLSESQLNVYLDIAAKEKKGAYVIPFAYVIPEGTGIGPKDAIERAVKAHPILGAHIEERDGGPWIVCGNGPAVSDNEIGLYDVDIYGSLSVFAISDGRITAMISHIAFDGFSLSALKDTFGKIFAGKEVGTDTGFLMSSSFDGSIRGSERYAKAKEYFAAQLCDADCDSGLMADHDGSPGESFHPFSQPAESIRRFASDMKVSIGAFFASAFAYTLSRYTGRGDAVFTVADNGRDLPGLENSVGMFVRTVPIRMDCSDRQISEFIRESARTLYDSVSSSVYPFRLVHNEFGIRSDIIFQYTAGVDAVGSSTTDIEGSDTAAKNCDLDVEVIEHADAFEVMVTHSGKHSPELIGRMMESFDMIVGGLMGCGKLSEIIYTAEADIAELDSLNRTETEVRNGNIVDVFYEKAESVPDNTFVTYLDRRYTYGAANVITDGIAYALSVKGIGKGDLVGVLVPRSEWYLLCALAVLKTGAGYVPIDESYPDERVLHMISDSKMKAILVTKETEERARRVDPSLAAIDATSVKGHGFAKVGIDPKDVAVILYTSGTTGKPKGSQITHLAVINHAEWYVRFTDMGEKDVYGLFASCAFDVHTTGYYPAIVAGASVDIVPEDVRLDLCKLNDHYAKTGTTHTFITTQVGRLFASMDMPSKIRVLMYGGEKLGEFTAPEHLGALETYGPSENLVLSTAIYVNDRCCPSSVGPIVDNIKGYILDKEGRRVPRGAIGELWLSGYQLSTGYLGNAELNAKVFRPNTFVTEEEREGGYDRIYATGDFFRFLPDGTLSVLGRRDGQVKIRGNRVELTEVENVIRSMKGVSNVTVQTIVNDRGGKELCAYVVSDGRRNADRIKRYVSERKPEYMVPSYVMFIDRIPLNANSKVDRRALPKPDTKELTYEYVAPRNDLERRICEAFAKGLGVEKVGIDDDFIKLGGDSLRAIGAITALRKIGISLSISDITRLGTAANIATVKGSTEECGYQYTDGLAPIDSQMNMIATVERHREFDYNICFMFRMPERFDAEKIRSIFSLLAVRHPLLYSRLEKTDGKYSFAFDKYIPVYESEEDVGEYVKKGLRAPDMFGDCLTHVTIFRGDDCTHLLFEVNHLVFDGFSLDIATKDLISISEGKDVPADHGFLEEAEHENGRRGSADYEESKRMVTELVDGSTVGYLAEGRSDGAGFAHVPLDADPGAIRRYVADCGITLNSFFAAALEMAFERITGKDRCLFYATHFGRQHLKTGNAVGLFAKGVPVSVAVKGRDTDGIMKDMKRTMDDMIANDSYPIWELMRDRGLEWDIRYQFFPLNGGEERNAGSDIGMEQIDGDADDLRVLTDIWTRVSELENGFEISIYRSARYPDSTIRQIAETWNDIVSETVLGK